MEEKDKTLILEEVFCTVTTRRAVTWLKKLKVILKLIFADYPSDSIILDSS